MKQDINFLYQVCVYLADQETKINMAVLASMADAFSTFLHCWTEFNETSQEARSQRFYKMFFFADWNTCTKMAALASDWLRHGLLLLCSRWTEFDKT